MKSCAECGHQNEDDAAICAECYVAFPPKPSEPAPPPNPADLKDRGNDLVVVGTFNELVEATLLKDRLEQAGIEACIPEDPSAFSNLPSLGRITVRVAKKDAEAAREALAAA